MVGLLGDLPNDWRVVPFGDVVSDSAFGPRFSGDLYADDGNVATLRTTDMDDDGAISYETMPLAKLDTAKFQNHILRKDDLVITRSGTCGIAGIFRGFEKPVLPGAFLIRLRLNEQADVRFYRYFFNSKQGREHLLSIAAGAVQQNINITNLEKLPVPLPPLPVQRRIAVILCAYDDFIENCERRIRILEEMARALYREWFIHFRYPGHEKSKLVPSPLGPIPQGWEICTLGDLVQFKSGFAFKGGTFTADGEHRLVTIRNVQDGAFNPESVSRIRELPAKLPPYCLLENGNILLSLTGNVGRVCLVYDGPFVLNQRVSQLVPTENFDWAMIYCMFREPEMRVRLEQLSNGVAQQNLSPVLASKMEIARFPDELRQTFATKATPMVRRIVQLYSTIHNLRKTRDLLLPRLLSGTS